MRYLLDTNACIAILNGNPEAVQQRLDREVIARSEVYVSSICLFELWFGVAKSSKREFNRKRLQNFLTGPLLLLSFEAEDAEFSGEIRARLEESGHPAGSYDMLITGQAIRNELILVTANTREFGRIKGLKIENWA